MKGISSFRTLYLISLSTFYWVYLVVLNDTVAIIVMTFNMPSHITMASFEVKVTATRAACYPVKYWPGQNFNYGTPGNPLFHSYVAKGKHTKRVGFCTCCQMGTFNSHHLEEVSKIKQTNISFVVINSRRSSTT